MTAFKPPARTKRTGSRSINLIDHDFRSCGDFIENPPDVFPDDAENDDHHAQQEADQRDQRREAGHLRSPKSALIKM